MNKKGLCSTCINDKECTFPRHFPVWQCEEYRTYDSNPTGLKKTTLKIRR